MLRMNIGQTNKLKEKDLGNQLRTIRELQVAKYELTSSTKSIYTQLPNSNIFFVTSSRPKETKRVNDELKKRVETFKTERVGTSFEKEQINI